MTQIRLALVCIALTSLCFGDVKGLDGTIQFDRQSDGQAEMTLNATGLGIGTSPSTNLHVAGNAIISQELNLGGASGGSNLNLRGSIGFGFQTVSNNTTLGAYSHVLVNTSSGNLNVTLPRAGDVTGSVYHIKKMGRENQLWIFSDDSIDGDDSGILLTSPDNGYSHVKLISHGSGWYLLNQSSDASMIIGAGNLVGWWKLDETSGNTAIDSSFYANHGTVTNMATANIGVSGKVSNALDFDGTNDYVELNNPNVLNSFDDQLTLMAWVNMTTSSHVVVGKSHSNTHTSPFYKYLLGNFSNKAHVRLGTTTLNSSTSINDGTWHHIAAVYDGASVKLYVDGELETLTSKTGTIDTSTRNVRIGARHTDAMGEYAKGKIDDVRIYNKSLSASDIENIYGEDIAWSPAFISTALWLDGNDSSTITADGSGNVSTWQDKSGSFLNATQGTANAHPKTGTRTLNGLNVIDFDGSDYFISSININRTTTPDLSVFAVFAQDATTGNFALFGNDNGGWDRLLLLNFDSQTGNEWGASNASGTTALETSRTSDTNDHLLSLIWDSGVSNGSQVSLDGATPTQFTEATGSSGYTTTGIGSIRPASLYPLNGYIAEIIFIDSIVDESTRQKIEGYLAHKWGLTANLPSGHPYKSTAP